MQSMFSQVEAVAAAHNARRVARVVVEVGEFSNVVPRLFEQAFLAFRQMEPLLEEARLELRLLPLKLRCAKCRTEFRPRRYRFRCPDCRGSETRIIQGEELLLRDIELEIEEEESGG